MSGATATTKSSRFRKTKDKCVFINNDFGKKRKLVTFNSNGAIYFPKLIREMFKGCYFAISVSEGKIILDPVKKVDFEEVINSER